MDLAVLSSRSGLACQWNIQGIGARIAGSMGPDALRLFNGSVLIA